MKILHLNTHDWQGGASIVAYRLAEMQNKCGHDSNILCGFRTTKNQIVKSLPLRKDVNNSRSKEGWLYDDILSSRNVIKHKLFEDANILNLHNLHGGYFNIEHLPELVNRIPTVWTLHDIQPLTGRCAISFDCNHWESGCGQCENLNFYPKTKVDASRQMWERKKEIYANLPLNLVCPSKWMMKNVNKSILAEKHSSIIYNGVDENLFKPTLGISKSILGLKESSILIGFVAQGGLDNPYKGSHFVKKISEKLFNSFPNLHLIEVGGEKTQSDSTARFIQYPYIEDQNHLVKIYNCLDLLIYPSTADNCPLVVLEAMSCGIPIITFPVGGIPELIKHNHSGFITDEISTKSLIDACIHLINSSNTRKKLGLNARQRVLNKFTLNIQNKAYSDLYENILKN